MKGIVVALLAFVALILAAMYFASHSIDQQDKEERSQGCVLESVGGTQAPGDFSVANGATLVFRGWAADTSTGRVPIGIVIVLVDGDKNESIAGKGKPSIDRPDVVATFRKPTILTSGFEISGKVATPRVGTWAIRLREQFSDRSVVCYSDKALRVRN